MAAKITTKAKKYLQEEPDGKLSFKKIDEKGI